MKRILLVDDDDFFRDTVRNFLVLSGYDVIDSHDAKEALKLFDDRIDLVATDLVMPEVSGVEFIEMIRKKSATVKIIAMSGYGFFSDAPIANDTAVKLTVDASYTKGGPIEDLVEIIKRTLAGTSDPVGDAD